MLLPIFIAVVFKHCTADFIFFSKYRTAQEVKALGARGPNETLSEKK